MGASEIFSADTNKKSDSKDSNLEKSKVDESDGCPDYKYFEIAKPKDQVTESEIQDRSKKLIKRDEHLDEETSNFSKGTRDLKVFLQHEDTDANVDVKEDENVSVTEENNVQGTEVSQGETNLQGVKGLKSFLTMDKTNDKIDIRLETEENKEEVQPDLKSSEEIAKEEKDNVDNVFILKEKEVEKTKETENGVRGVKAFLTKEKEIIDDIHKEEIESENKEISEETNDISINLDKDSENFVEIEESNL